MRKWVTDTVKPQLDTLQTEWKAGRADDVATTEGLVDLVRAMDLHRVAMEAVRDSGMIGARQYGPGQRLAVCVDGKWQEAEVTDAAASEEVEVDVKDVEAFSPALRSIIFAPDHFAALGLPVSADASAVEVERSFRAKARAAHPDKNRSGAGAAVGGGGYAAVCGHINDQFHMVGD